ncbi:MAG: hypothetical protein JNL45_05255 [Hyphomicrobium sp.]|jgi:4'-phosphopantetheinyl transferase|nr:hypothetical protein [Hyphomicrobium sp.]
MSAPLPDTALELWLVDLDATVQTLMAAEADCSRLSPQEAERAQAIPDIRVRQRWLSAHIALRLLLERWGGAGLRAQPYQFAPGGRPFLSGPAPHFSLSHAGQFALIGLTRSAPLGVDIEVISPRVMPPERRSRLMAFANDVAGGAAELTLHLPPEDGAHAPAEPAKGANVETAALIQAWCRVEAFAKADGRGLLAVLSQAGIMGPAKDASGAGAAACGSLGPVRGPVGEGTCPSSSPLSGYRVWDVPLGSDAQGYAAAVALARGARISSDALIPRLLEDIEAASTPLMRQADVVLSPADDGG